MKNKITLMKFFKNLTQTKRAGILFLILSALAIIKPANIFAQTGLPAGSCGIEYIYDAAGNMVERHYICNNSSGIVSIQTLKSQNKTSSVKAVTSLYPNPTTGKFSIKMVKPLQNAQVEIVNVQGSVIFKSMMNGTLLQFDLSGKASGTYFIKIFDAERIISAQVIKQ